MTTLSQKFVTRAFHVHNDNRVIAFHRWVEGVGADVIVVASFSEQTHYSYRVGFPSRGRWREMFNSDAYEGLPNPAVAGNSGEVVADGFRMHEFSTSAEIVIPANSILIFAR